VVGEGGVEVQLLKVLEVVVVAAAVGDHRWRGRRGRNQRDSCFLCGVAGHRLRDRDRSGHFALVVVSYYCHGRSSGTSEWEAEQCESEIATACLRMQWNFY
jgi:hypothetical protein